MTDVNDSQIGKVGEYLVCADLILKGYVAYLSEQGLHYDVVLDNNGVLYKIQVKTTRLPMKVPQRKKRTMKYCFHVRRMGNGGRKSYECRDVDFFALVALDTKTIGYIPLNKTKQTMFFLPENTTPINDASEKKKKIKQLRRDGLTFDEISKQINVGISYAHRVVNGKENKSFSTTYLSDWRIEDVL